MKTIVLAILLSMLMISSAVARDSLGNYSVKEALAQKAAQTKLSGDVSFYFGKSKHGKVIKNYGTVNTNKKTNSFNKSDKEACQWVFLSAMIALEESAVSQGGNAVINIKSNYKSKLHSSNSSFQCGAGALMAGVALEGTIVKIKK
ncbi:hypothetical protein [Desulfotalea psychrophila]|uniref:Related to excinuclease ATPase n=1 Tax=Desulfotalea psychrophila (strain LSv54 / DSM 12343) TaxID=177439 RepID=Q6ANF5_DESPS|nr:hypothetical protein [Desulfotalea psychrophila]CAG36119.1 related to excinuclease ATPase [Desulfotalea psychrophila LSv54]